MFIQNVGIQLCLPGAITQNNIVIFTAAKNSNRDLFTSRLQDRLCFSFNQSFYPFINERMRDF
jgi:hypothetical protein